jgi:DNA-binding NtrC family response regulator
VTTKKLLEAGCDGYILKVTDINLLHRQGEHYLWISAFPTKIALAPKKIIRVSEQLKQFPLIAVTNDTGVEPMNKASHSGFDGFLDKPIDPDRFPDQIRNTLVGDPVCEMS